MKLTSCFVDTFREVGERPPGAAAPLVQSSLALLQIQPEQLQGRASALPGDWAFAWKLTPPSPAPLSNPGAPPLLGGGGDTPTSLL